ncbi:hypothetical protein CDAR_489731 [Caerostris darwini]|uniref:Uncharacterized protein n=1 Tax=Caerostris darwini TaxID=1538125 RepID=A0AAV4VKT6_9ARAC|nr:hypothetical protein CDAR_489731 [Caerostris darwini]
MSIIMSPFTIIYWREKKALKRCSRVLLIKALRTMLLLLKTSFQTIKRGAFSSKIPSVPPSPEERVTGGRGFRTSFLGDKRNRRSLTRDSPRDKLPECF